MTTTLVLPTDLVQALQAAARSELETAAVLTVRLADTPTGDLRVLGRRLYWAHESAYLRRDATGLSITPKGYVAALGEAETKSETCIWVHTHPGEHATPYASVRDGLVDQQISDVFRLRSGSPYYGTLIVSPRQSSLAFTGYMQHEEGPVVPIDRVWCVGDQWRLIPSHGSVHQEFPAIFDRHIRAFGPAIQATLGELRIAIVGCGGTGSAVAEQLVRLGVRHLMLVDPDRVTISNVTRVYGTTAHDVGSPKVDVLANHLRRISPQLRCECITAMVTREAVARQLTSYDLIFGCTDDNAGRLVLSRISSYLLTPVIDCGVLLTSDDHAQLAGIHGRVTTLAPGQACLVCRDRIDLQRAAAELLTPDERKRRVDEGYAPALQNTEPAVIAYTTMVAATAISELLERLIAFGPSTRPSEVLLRCHDREVSTNIALPRERHYCHHLSGKLGLGVTQPFLEQVWPP